MPVGFIGLGHLGKAMCERLLETGHELLVWNRTPEKANGLSASLAKSPSHLASECDMIILNLFDSGAVREVLTMNGGLLEQDLSGKIVIDSTTNHFEAVPEFDERISGREGAYLEAPVLGSVVPARQGKVTILISGKEAAYEKSRPLLEKLGATIFYLPERGAAARMKLINNLVLGAFMASLAEATALGEAAGLERREILDILDAGGGKSLVLTAKRQKLLDQDFSPHFSSALIYKDLHCLQDLARKLGRACFTGSVVKELYGVTFERDESDLDFSAIYKLFGRKR
jgi:3-hydroxyisobutyrate dehydrogenase